MARSFIYDSIGFSEATLTAGSYAQAGDPWTATFTANSALISNIDRLADQNISLSMGNYWERYEVLKNRFRLTEITECNSPISYQCGAE